MSDWISVKDRLPEREQQILLYIKVKDAKFIKKGTIFICNGFLQSTDICDDIDLFEVEIPPIICEYEYTFALALEGFTNIYNDDEVKYWMPLPEPPK